jgi:hypothetical protein
MAAIYGSIVFLVVCTSLLRLGPQEYERHVSSGKQLRLPWLYRSSMSEVVFVVHFHDPTVSLRVRVGVDDGQCANLSTTSLHTSRSGQLQTVHL